MSFALWADVEQHSSPTGQKEPAAADGVALMGQVTGSRNTTGSEKEIGMTTENANRSPLGEISPAAPNHNAPNNVRRGAECREFARLQLEGENFSLNIPFYRTIGWGLSFGSPTCRVRQWRGPGFE
jgi:hypothetical protein